MNDKVIISKLNEVYIKIKCEPSIAYELRDAFSFKVENYFFMPAFKAGIWDGSVRLFNILTGCIYAGLQKQIEEFCKERNYEIEYTYDTSFTKISLVDIQEFIKTLKLPFEPHKHQMEAFLYAVESKRALLISPTGSGKTLLDFLLIKYFNKKSLIIVPTTNLVTQLYSDFIEYGMDENSMYKVYAGQDKNTNKQIICSTWQSLVKMPKSYFEQFELVIGEEADGFEAKSLTSIMTKLVNCSYRFGVTGTLKGTQINQLVLEGLFGPIKTVATTSELMNKKILSDLKINVLVLNYSEKEKKVKRNYITEIDFILSHLKRNEFIKNLALSREGNTLVLFQFIEKHGRPLYEQILKDAGERPVFFVWSEIKGDDRDQIRKLVENQTNAIIIASSVFVRGVNIKSLKHLISTSPTKARRTVLQAIGRTLRRSKTKSEAILYDVVDNLGNNYALQHYIERSKIYMEENFQVKTYNINL
jgi:superfamily II DNA or RNA helicase